MLGFRLLTLALSLLVSQIQPTAVEAGPEVDALEVLMRNVTLGRTGPVFVRLYGRDPGKKTLARLALIYPKILAASKSEWVVTPGSNLGGFYRQKDTREPGHYFEVEGFKQLNSRELVFTAGWEQACNLFQLEKSNSGWRVSRHSNHEPCY